MQLTEYDKKTFKLIEEKLTVEKWYSIDQNRKDYKELVESIDKFHECYGLIEWFDDSKTKYKLVLRKNVIHDLVSNQNTAALEPLQSIKNTKTIVGTKKEKEGLKKDVNRHPNWSIPIFRSRPDIGERIMAEYNAKSESKRLEDEKQKEKLKKIQEWKKK